MYSILFHLLWLSLLEIIFYFEYVGPLETYTYKNTIKRLIEDKEEENIIINNYNKTNLINLDILNLDIENSKEEREEYNYKLYMKSIHYWLILFGIVIGISSITLFIKYRLYLNRKREMDISNREIEFVTIRNRSLTQDNDELSDNNDLCLNREETFFNYHKIKKTIIKKSIFYIGLGILILGFEYLFFNYIVMKYKVLSDDEILYLIYELLNPMLNELI